MKGFETMAERKDSWTDQDDTILAQVVIKHASTGSTQLAAFKEVAERIGRSSSACGFRWNSEVRKHYDDAFKQALTAREGKTRKTRKQEAPVETAPVAEQIIKVEHSDILKKALEDIAKAFEGIIEENQRLTSENIELKAKHDGNSEDLQALLKMIENAKVLGILKNPAV
jgi:prespore-specific regulator